MSFEEFGLSPEIMSGLADTRIEPTPLQKNVIPKALQGTHILAKNEAGEEGVFLIPALQKLHAQGEVNGTKVLILTPSIERAKRIDEMVWAMGYHAQISSASLAMKGNRGDQEEAVKDGAPVIVANPGRLIEILNKNKLKMSELDVVIIDDAQDMDNYNLVNRVKDILKYVESDPQMLIFAKEYNKATSQLADHCLKNAEAFGFDYTPPAAETPATDQDSSSSGTKEEKKNTSEADSGKQESEESTADAKTAADPEEKEEQKQEEAKADSDSDTDADADTDSDSGSDEEEEEFVLDMDEVLRKLEAASVDVVLNPEENKEEEEDSGSDDEGDDQEDDSSAQNAKADSKEEEVPKVPKNLEQTYIYVPPRAKISTLLAHLEGTLTDQIVVFAASKRTTDRLFRIIRKKGWGVVSINEGLDEQTYNDRFAKFTDGDMKILLVGGISATEVDLEYAKQVINYDVPGEVEEYKYRAELVGNGKAARMVSLVSKMDRDDINTIVEKVGYAPTEIPLPEEVKEKKKGGKKDSDKKKSKGRNNGSSNNNKSKNKDRDRDKDKKSSGKKRSNKRRSRNDDRNDDSRSRRRKPKPEKKKHGLPMPSYEGLSGGKEGNKDKKRPSPGTEAGAFGWIKKLFN